MTRSVVFVVSFWVIFLSSHCNTPHASSPGGDVADVELVKKGVQAWMERSRDDMGNVVSQKRFQNVSGKGKLFSKFPDLYL